MAYHGFARPEFIDDDHDTGDWIDWLEQQPGVLVPVAPRHKSACKTCHGASAYLDGGPQTWPECVHCHKYDDAVDAVVPITYSVDAGLESMLHRYKDFDGYDWLRKPLAALLQEFVDFHGDCLDDQAPGSGVDIATIMPPGAGRRANHLDGLIRGVVAGDPLLDRWDWDMDFLTRDVSVSRPARGHLTPSAYEVAPGVVEDSSVIVLDDTWTSGSSAASAAAALKEAGAAHVTVLTLGRQLNIEFGYGSTNEIYAAAHSEAWQLHECVICA